MWELNPKQKRKEDGIVEVDQSLWNSSNAYYNMKNSNNSGNNYEVASNVGSAHSSTRTLPVKLTGKTVLDDSSSDMSGTDEGQSSPARNTRDLNVRLV